MPYFTWQGIDIIGQIHKGKLFARSKEELDTLLFKQEIALLSCSPVKQWSLFSRSVKVSLKIQLFKQLSELLSAGVLLPDALLIISSQTEHARFQEVIDSITQKVHEGSSLSQSLSCYPRVFDQVMVQMVHVGEESGRLVAALTMLSDYLQMGHDFRRRLRSAAMVPMFTFSFFCFVALLIIMVIMPRFIGMFQSVKQELPYVTQVMISMSSFLRSRYMMLLVGAGFLVGFVMRLYAQTARGSWQWDRFLLTVPWVGFLIKQSSLAYFLHALAMLLNGGMQLVPALALAQQTISNKVIHYYIGIIEREVEAGSSLSQAMLHDPAQLFGPDSIAIVRVGEESGRLSTLLSRAAVAYQDRVKRSLKIITAMINPLLMIVLGLLITFLIFSVYLPVFHLSDIL
ncbi:MAG: type II secretion system F family protein [Candidatus Dependentiae bacterium]|nr:type II secretion system F family protein [Candidatus Dependentiae bacterium]